MRLLLLLCGALVLSASALAGPAGAQAVDTEAGISAVATRLADVIANAGLKFAGVPELTNGTMAPGGTGECLGGAAGAAGHYFAKRLSDALVNASNGRFEVVERSRVTNVLQELNIQNSGLVDPDTIRGVIGQIQGLDALVDGSVTRMDKSRALELSCRVITLPAAKNRGSATAKISLTPDLLSLFDVSYSLPPEPQPGSVVVQAALNPEGMPPELDPACPYGLQILSRGEKKAAYRGPDGKVYVPARADEVFTVRLTNRSQDVVAVALYLDGKNSIGMANDLPERAPKWVLKPGQSAEIRGWQMSGDEARQFVFGLGDESTAARTRYSDGIGLIKAAFYPAVTATERGGLVVKAGDRIPSPTVQYKGEFLRTPVAQLALRYDQADIVTRYTRAN